MTFVWKVEAGLGGGMSLVDVVDEKMGEWMNEGWRMAIVVILVATLAFLLALGNKPSFRAPLS